MSRYRTSGRAIVMLGVLCAVSVAEAQEAAEASTDPGFEIVGPGFFAIRVEDDEASSAWYQKALGLREIRHLEDDDGSHSIRILSRAGLALELIRLGSPGPDETSPLGLFKAGLYVDDIEAAFAWVRSLGASTDERIFTDETLGAPSFVFRDPDGNRLQVFERWQAPPAWLEAIDPFRIADGLYYVGTAGLASYLVTSDEGHILIDAPMQANTQLVLSNIRRLGFEPRDVRLQLATHAHFDHVGGIAGMREATGAELVLSEEDARLIGQGGGPRAPFRAAQADRLIGHLETVAVGNRTLSAHLTPGHTRGCTSWSGEVEIGGEPLTFVLVCSLTVLPNYRLVGEDETYPGIARDFCTSLAHLRSLEPDIFLASHGDFMGLAEKLRALTAGDERAFVDPERYGSYLDRAEDAIETALEDQGHQGGCATMDGRQKTE